MATQKTLRTCDKGHQYYKSSDCPVCPICENARKADKSPFATLGAPARRALENNGISDLKQLSGYSEKQILKLHGMGPGSMPKLRDLLEEQGLAFKSA